MSTFVINNNDRWVLIDSDTDCDDYYLQGSVIRENHNIKVWVKRVYNQQKINNEFLKRHMDNHKIDTIHHTLILYSFNYIDYLYCIESILHYNSDDMLLVDIETHPKCKPVKPDSRIENIFKRIIKGL
jgi:hypothetical protein